MVNVINGDTIDIKAREFKDPKQVFKTLKGGCIIIQHNWNGNETEAIIRIFFKGKMPDIKEVNRLVKNFWEKVQRRLPKVIFVKVLVYEEKDCPHYEFWIKRVDGEKLEIQQEEMEQIWEENGEVRIEKLNPTKVGVASEYFMKGRVNMEVYPPHIQILRILKVKRTQKSCAKRNDLQRSREKSERICSNIPSNQKSNGYNQRN